MKLTFRTTIEEGESFWMLARPEGPSGDTITQAYVTAVGGGTLKVFDRASATPNTAVYSKTMNSAADPPATDECMFLAAQTDGNWEGLDGGYTFWWPHHPSDYTLEGGRVYEFEVELTVDKLTGQTFPILNAYGTLAMTWIVNVNGRASD